LELACGTGRIAEPLLRSGAQYTGMDIEKRFLRSAQKKLSKYKGHFSIHYGDMRSFNFKTNYDLIFIGFNSFLHLLTDEDVLDFFQCVKNHMHAKTRFIIDIYIPDPLFLYRPKNMRFPVLEYVDSKTKQNIYVEETNQYNRKTEINKITWYFSSKGKKDFDIRSFSVRMYFPSKMHQLLTEAGFTILHQWGDYYQTNMNTGSSLQIYDTIVKNLP